MTSFAALPIVVYFTKNLTEQVLSSKSTVGTVIDVPVKDPMEGPYRVFQEVFKSLGYYCPEIEPDADYLQLE